MVRKHKHFFVASATVLMSTAFFVAAQTAHATYGDTSTLAGKPYDGDGGIATSANLDFPDDVTVDSNGVVYIADTANNAIRVVATNGIISTLAGGSAGYVNGSTSVARFAQPSSIARGSDGTLYIADTGNDAIRTISPSGTVATLVSSGLANPTGIALAGSTLFIVDTGNNALKSVSISGGAVTTITTALNDPRKVAVTSNGTTAYIADNGSRKVLSVDIGSSVVTTLAGSGDNSDVEGVGTAASFSNVTGVALSADERTLYVSDAVYRADRIRTIDIQTGQTASLIEDDLQTLLSLPSGLVVANGYVYVAANGISTVHRFSLTNPSGDNGVVAGSDRFNNRDGSDPLFGRPRDLVLSPDRKYLYVAENNRIRRITLADKSAITITGSIVDNYREGLPVGDGVLIQNEARFSTITGIAISGDGKTLYVSDRWNDRIRKVHLDATPITTELLTGAGRVNRTGDVPNAYQEGTKCDSVVDQNDTLTIQSGCAYIQGPTGLVLDPTETYLYFSDTGNNRIRRVKVADGSTSLVAGGSEGYKDATGSDAQFNTPSGIALNAEGTLLYVADKENHKVRVIDIATHKVTTLAGAATGGYREGIGSSAFFSLPERVKMGADGNLYIAEAGSQRIRQLNPTTKLTKLVSGSGNLGYVDGKKAVATFDGLAGIAPDTSNGMLYAADSSNDVIRMVNIEGIAPYTNPAPTVTAVLPKEVAASWDAGTGLRVKIKGTGFVNVVSVKLYTYSVIKLYGISTKEVVVTLPLKKMQPGWYDVTVTNVDGQYAVLESGLGIRSPITGKVPDVFFTLSDSRGFSAYNKTWTNGFFVATGNVWGDSKKEIISGIAQGRTSLVNIFSSDGMKRGSWYAYGNTSRVGVRIAACDLNGDGTDEILTAPSGGMRPLVRIFNRAGKQILKKEFVALTSTFRGGVNIACGDVTGDGVADIIIAGGKGGDGSVRAYSSTGVREALWYPYGKTFHGGITLAAYSPGANATRQVVVGAETGNKNVRLYSGTGKLLKDFASLGLPFTAGVNVATGDTNGDGIDELVVVPQADTAIVRVLNVATQKRRTQFYAYTKLFHGGASLAVGDVNGDGVADIVTIPASGYMSSVRMYSQSGKSL